MTSTTDAKTSRKARSTSSTAKSTRTAKRAEQAPKATGLTAAEVARTNELDPRKFRAFLRSNDIERTFATKAEATKAVKAFRKG